MGFIFHRKSTLRHEKVKKAIYLQFMMFQVHLTGRHFNDRAVYTCDDGYQIVGLEQVICNSNGQWSGAQPSCKQGTSSAQSRYYCGNPPVIQHAKHNGSDEQVSIRVTFNIKNHTFRSTWRNWNIF